MLPYLDKYTDLPGAVLMLGVGQWVRGGEIRIWVVLSLSFSSLMGPPGVLGIWGEWLFIFRELGSTGNYFRGASEKAHSFGDLGSPAKNKKN